MRGYLIANYTINDPAIYQKYVEAVMPVIAKYGGKLIIGDFEPKKLEGSPNQGVVAVEFENTETAEKFYNSPEYTEGKKLRLASTEGWVIIAREFPRDLSLNFIRWAESIERKALQYGVLNVERP